MRRTFFMSSSVRFGSEKSTPNAPLIWISMKPGQMMQFLASMTYT